MAMEISAFWNTRSRCSERESTLFNHNSLTSPSRLIRISRNYDLPIKQGIINKTKKVNHYSEEKRFN
jgi:hypothetical protein